MSNATEMRLRKDKEALEDNKRTDKEWLNGFYKVKIGARLLADCQSTAGFDGSDILSD